MYPTSVVFNSGEASAIVKIINDKIKNIDDNSPFESNTLEAVTMYLYIKYDDSDSYENIQKFMMDLEVDNNMIILEFVCQITEDKIHTRQASTWKAQLSQVSEALNKFTTC